MFNDRPVRYGRTPEPETPYQKAAQVWDERIGSARVQARNWRLMAFGSLLLSGGLAAGLVWQSTRGTIVPWVVQVDKLGEAQAVAPAIADYQPTDPQIAFHLARFIEDVRAISGRSGHRPPELAARLRLHHRPGRRGAQRLCPHQRPLCQARQAAGRGRGLQRHPRLARQLPRRLDRAPLRGRRLGATERWTAILTVVIAAAHRRRSRCGRIRSASTSTPSTGRRSWDNEPAISAKPALLGSCCFPASALAGCAVSAVTPPAISATTMRRQPAGAALPIRRSRSKSSNCRSRCRCPAS